MHAPLIHPKKQLAFFHRHLSLLPAAYETQDAAHVTLLFFILGAMKLVQATEHAEVQNASKAAERHSDLTRYLQKLQYPSTGLFAASPSHTPTITATYSAIAIAYMYNITITNRDLLTNSLLGLINKDGSVRASTHEYAECDIRMSYCLFAALEMIGETDKIPQSSMRWVDSCRTWDGGYAQRPGGESHGGSFYCGIAATEIYSRYSRSKNENERGSDEKDTRKDEQWWSEQQMAWGVQRQGPDGGISGRIGKDSDTCYGFWIGAGLAIKHAKPLIESQMLKKFIDSTVTSLGGFTKHPEVPVPDLLHAYMGVAAQYSFRSQFDPVLNVTLSKHDNL